ncbi:tetratricopeptide repeat protein [Flavihumibacter rivuli]|uniref:tetratricopeptide repeat protein n=1 Tax=Flavihumibacter rivuli TaxID=2838156 RepID=UPI001BDE8254|nr:tetratricopeptide repeat protein [Flavihumibacter rivuli]ULQ55176.1 tetratricopeptide repeat protein [Flavihumibacter rivuli]
MKRLLILLFLINGSYQFAAAQQDIKTQQANARNFMQQGDYSNAILVLNKALEQDPGNIELQNDLVFSHYLMRNLPKAIELGKKVVEQGNADIRSFQQLGMCYEALDEKKDAERLYKEALKKFPNSGVFYSELGEVLWAKKDFPTAVQYWERGIEIDPNYSGNYYNAAKHYYLSTDKVWALIYGEIFVNLESYSKRTAEIRELLLNSYKKYFSQDKLQAPDPKNPFATAVAATLDKHASSVNTGVTTETLTMLRTRFILSWFEKEPVALPFRLFDYQRQLLKEGMFDAYNQWLFGPAQNLQAFQQWTSNHAAAYNQFLDYQKGRVFKVPAGQYYQSK